MIDLTGQTFGKLTVVRKLDRAETIRSEAMFECLCLCGQKSIVAGYKLRTGQSQCSDCYRSRPSTDAAVVTQIIASYKYQGEKRCLVFSLSRDEVCILLFAPCFYCGCKPTDAVRPNYSRVGRDRRHGLSYNGIDRRDNTVGYILSNVVSCCRICNRAKNELSYAEFVDWIRKVHGTLHARNN